MPRHNAYTYIFGASTGVLTLIQRKNASSGSLGTWTYIRRERADEPFSVLHEEPHDLPIFGTYASKRPGTPKSKILNTSLT